VKIGDDVRGGAPAASAGVLNTGAGGFLAPQLKAFTDLAGAVITVDALHTQSDTAQAIAGRHADYVMTVKASMPPWWSGEEGSASPGTCQERLRRPFGIGYAAT
jgi:hypothetical protein